MTEISTPQAGDFRCGRCGNILDGGTDEPTAARDMRAAVERIADWIERDRREPDKVLCHLLSLRREIRP